MIKGRSSRAIPRSAGYRPGLWTIARGLLLALTVAFECLPRLTHGPARIRLLGFIRSRTALMEHIFRLLLICMRAKPAAPRPSPFTPRAVASPEDIAVPRRRRVAFALSLSQLAKGFAQYGGPAAVCETRTKRPPLNAPGPPRGPTAAAPVADPLAQIETRLKAMRALLDDPHRHAARLASLLKAAGIRLRLPRPLIPDAQLWTLLRHTPLEHPFAAPAFSADTS